MLAPSESQATWGYKHILPFGKIWLGSYPQRDPLL
jgi:hypothetical protein